MSESNVPFLDSLSATRKFHTNQRSNGTDTVEEYVQGISEPYLTTYTISVTTAISTATANSHLLQIMAGASSRVCLRRLYVTQMVNGTTQTNQWSLHRLSTAGTGGTVYTPAANDPADAASGATAMTLPTVKGAEGVAIGTFAILTHATAATVGLNPIYFRDWALERTKGIWIAAGAANGIALKNITASASTTVHITAVIVESPEGA